MMKSLDVIGSRSQDLPNHSLHIIGLGRHLREGPRCLSSDGCIDGRKHICVHLFSSQCRHVYQYQRREPFHYSNADMVRAAVALNDNVEYGMVNVPINAL